MSCTIDNLYSSPHCNRQLLEKEIEERSGTQPPSYIYPTLNDPNFNVKIAHKKEFNDTQYDGTIYPDVKEQADKLANVDFELQPHQAFVKNYLSSNTPYNGMLLMHGVGTGKTCSAIGVTEEVRDSMRELGFSKKIIIVASENVQENFKLQLFDERKLKFEDGQWSIKSCLGNKLLKEINPTNIKGLTHEKITAMIKNIIRTYYIFMGYGQFANYIRKTITGISEQKNRATDFENVVLTQAGIRALKREFEGRMIVIDEVHNIRKTDEGNSKKVAMFLELLISTVRNMKLLFLSATPMFNSYKEIIWLINLLNMNDNRAKIQVGDVFEKDGTYKSGGETLLTQKAAGYVSFVRGENPYTFPYRVYPEKFAHDHTFKVVAYPRYQMNSKRIPDDKRTKRVLDLYLNFMANGASQTQCYQYIIAYLRHNLFGNGDADKTIDFENMESFGYSILQIPIQSLIISYPIIGLSDAIANIADKAHQLIHSPSSSASSASSASSPPKAKPKAKPKPKLNRINAIGGGGTSFLTFMENNRQAGGGGAASSGGADEEIDDSNSTEETDDNASSSVIDELDEMADKRTFPFATTTLVGKRGLDRIMTTVTTEKQPQYTYKPQALKQFGRIFTYDKIGNHSAKMRTILEYIKKSDGIILIYSQYIEGGIVPMALALEEMGLIRYSEKSNGSDNLLYRDPADPNAPTPIDVRSLSANPPAPAELNAKNTLMPARYAMITGNARLSPNSVFDVAGLTGENNKDGHVVKVVMVSVSGAEGIDLKYVRQVHILDPWFNMNRIEQIVGRAVRNFSHKILSFEEHNVQIFMHGSIIEDSYDEAADLYVYRAAESKAINIGRVSRSLKKSAVDCILNHSQTNFTQDNMEKAMKTPVTQMLSDGTVLKNFRIGDAPFSAVCDYMNTCAYACSPSGNANAPGAINDETYNENFLYLNTEKIAQRVRLLMREGFFYSKADLINAIQTPRKYPIAHIYATLTTFVDDRSETVVDKYGRIGYLQNIGDYYLFLPQELSDKYAPLFDRMRPIDYKNRDVNYALGAPQPQPEPQPQSPPINVAAISASASASAAAPNIYRQSVTAPQQPPQPQQPPPPNLATGIAIYDRLKNLYHIAEHEMKHGSITEAITTEAGVEVTDETTYRIYGKMMQKTRAMQSGTFEDLTQAKMLEYLVSHMLDNIAIYTDKRDVMNYIYSPIMQSLNMDSTATFDFYAKQYFENKKILVKIKSGRREIPLYIMMLCNYSQGKCLFLQWDTTDNIWKELTPDDIIEYKIEALVSNQITIKKDEYNSVVGFISYVKKTDSLVFKMINLLAPRDKGYVCMQAGKKKIIDMLNSTLGAEIFTKDNTKSIHNSSGKVTQILLNPADLCIIQEFMLRYFNDVKYNGIKWFIGPEISQFNLK